MTASQRDFAPSSECWAGGVVGVNEVCCKPSWSRVSFVEKNFFLKKTIVLIFELKNGKGMVQDVCFKLKLFLFIKGRKGSGEKRK